MEVIKDLIKSREGLCLDRSHTIVVTKQGACTVHDNMACYSHLWGGYPSMDKLYLFFPTPEVEGVEEYVDWVLNSELFGEAFKTKSYKEGQEYGYEVDIDLPTNFLFSAMAALRFPWEAGHNDDWGYSWDYQNFRQLGFSIKQAFFLTVNFDFDGETIYIAGYNSNHLPIPRDLPWEFYHSKYFARQEESMRERVSSQGVTSPWFEGSGYIVTETIFETFFGKCENPYSFAKVLTDDLVEKLKQELKEE